uniref:Nicotinamide riboside kinase 2 n=1 Tax=Anas platyrhynchos platyrhynchos TaxID=8840 RepID=A0A493TNC9_ANAPP
MPGPMTDPADPAQQRPALGRAPGRRSPGAGPAGRPRLSSLRAPRHSQGQGVPRAEPPQRLRGAPGPHPPGFLPPPLLGRVGAAPGAATSPPMNAAERPSRGPIGRESSAPRPMGASLPAPRRSPLAAAGRRPPNGRAGGGGEPRAAGARGPLRSAAARRAPALLLPAAAMSIVIGIGGVTNGGKTTLTRKLMQALPNCSVVHQDDFFKPQDEIEVEDGFKQYDGKALLWCYQTKCNS